MKREVVLLMAPDDSEDSAAGNTYVEAFFEPRLQTVEKKLQISIRKQFDVQKKKSKVKPDIKEVKADSKEIKIHTPVNLLNSKSLMHRIESESGLNSALKNTLKAAK